MTRRSWYREIGNPLSLFQGAHPGRGNKKWSAFRLVVIGLWIAFLMNWPQSPWGAWDFGALAVLVFAFPVADLFAAAPVMEALGALAAIFGATVAKRVSVTKTETRVEETPPADETDDHEWADGSKEGVL